MTLTIGRVGTDGLLGEASTVSVQGDTVTLKGTAKGLVSLAAWRLLRDQLRGLTGPDEPVVPMTSSNDPSLNGFYTVANAQVDTMPDAQHGLWLNWEVDLTRVPDVDLPVVDSLLVGGYRAYAASLGTPLASSAVTPWWTVSNRTLSTSQGGTSDGTTSDDGDSMCTVTLPTGVLTEVVSWEIAAEDWYASGCRLETKLGSVFHPIMGRYGQVDRINNGLISLTLPTASGASGAALDLAAYKASTGWSAGKRFNVYNVDSILSTSITVNTPWMVAVTLRCGVTLGGAIPTSVTMDIILRRGATWAEIVIGDPASTAPHGLLRSTAEAGTNINGGIRASANDTDGNRYIMLAGASYTTNTTSGGMQNSVSGAQFPMALGSIIGGSSPLLSASTITTRYYAPYGETVAFSR